MVLKGRNEQEKQQLLLLTSKKNTDFDADKTVAMMIHTNVFEKSVPGGTAYWDCFKGTDIRRAETVCCVWAVQTLRGSTFMGYSTYFYEQAGIDTSNAFSLSIAQYVLEAISTMSSWFLMTKFGRRSLYLYGQVIIAILLVVISFAAIGTRGNSTAQWAIGSMLLAYTFTYDATVGPVCYSLVAELSSMRLRNKTVVLARNF